MTIQNYIYIYIYTKGGTGELIMQNEIAIQKQLKTKPLLIIKKLERLYLKNLFIFCLYVDIFVRWWEAVDWRRKNNSTYIEKIKNADILLITFRSLKLLNGGNGFHWLLIRRGCHVIKMIDFVEQSKWADNGK